ncbi:MAG: inositol monophosphatase [Ktedonobacterales bacterium]|nr:inositol monophosphatase [Ktedonobacterales bacterium]
MIRERDRLLAQLRELHTHIQRDVVAQTERQSLEVLAAVASDDAHEHEGDTIFAIDRVSEQRLIAFFEREVAPERPLVLIAEGLPDVGDGPGCVVLPRGSRQEHAEVRVLMDPIDGTRGLMYQKRSAWILSGVAPNRGPATCLRDIELAVQTEIPLVKQHLADALWAFRGEGLHAERVNQLTGARAPLHPRPSAATSIAQGFAMISRFFPGAREELAAIDDEIARAALGPVRQGKASCWEDQYISSGGQLYELIAGHDRFVADIRPLMEPLLARRGLSLVGICCHPYDVATVLLAEEAGVLITDARGHPLDAPLTLDADVAWAGFANAAIRAQVEPLLTAALARRGLLSLRDIGR